MNEIITTPTWILVTGVLVVGTMLGVALLSMNDSRWREILSQWLGTNGYQLESADYRVFRLGPFTWRSWRGHAVFYVVVVEQNGTLRKGWIRLSDPFRGSVDGEVEVEWET